MTTTTASINALLSSADSLAQCAHLLENYAEEMAKAKAELAKCETRVRDAVTRTSSVLVSNSVALAASSSALQEAVVAMDGVDGDAMRELTVRLERVRRLQVARSYLDVLARTQHLVERAMAVAERSPRSALDTYSVLASLVASSTISPTSQTHAYVSAQMASLHKTLAAVLASCLAQTLEALDWPSPIKLTAGTSSILAEMKLRKFRRAFADTLLLPPSPPTSASSNDGIARYPGQLAVDIMLAAVILRFKFHFLGSRPTSRLDKPEWYFTWALDAIRDHAIFLDDECQPLLPRNTAPSIKQLFIDGLVAVIMAKMDADAERVLVDPPLLSRTIAESLAFDAALRDSHGFRALDGSDWAGTVAVFVKEKSRFRHWVACENEFAQSRLAEIIGDPDAFQHSNEDDSDTSPRPTHSAESLVSLLEAITDRYRLLPSLASRIRLLTDIQLPVIAMYAAEIARHVSVFERARFASSVLSLATAVAAEDKEKASGAAGIERLARYIDGLEWVKQVLVDWAEDVFYLEMWRDVAAVSYQHNISYVSTSAAIADDVSGSIFDDAIQNYSELVVRIEAVISRCVVKDVTASLAPYLKKSWPLNATVASASSPDASDISPELGHALSDLARGIAHLARILSQAHLHAVFRRVAADIDQYLWTRLILVRDFGRTGALQLATDFRDGLCSAGGSWVRRPERYYPRLRDACYLLSRIPATEKEKNVVGGDWSATELIDAVKPYLKDRKAKDALDPTTVREFLESVGVYALTGDEVYEVLSRRADLG